MVNCFVSFSRHIYINAISLVILNFLKSLFKKLMFCFRIVLNLQRVSACGDSVSPMVTILYYCVYQSQLPYGSDSKEPTCNAGDPGSIPGLGRSTGERNGNPLQYSCLENPMDGGASRATVHGVTKSRTQLSCFTFTYTLFEFPQLVSNIPFLSQDPTLDTTFHFVITSH